MSLKTIILAVAFLFDTVAHAQADPRMRTWVDQQGRSIQAALIKTEGTNVVLQLETGATATVPLSRFSAADQAFVQQQGTNPPTAGRASSPTALVWPETITVAVKDLEIREGPHIPAERRYVYQSGSFRFESNAPLVPTVMREIARDFELTRALFLQLPWDWEPKPRGDKPFFQANLYETEKDYVAAGGAPDSSADSNAEFIFTKFSTLGLKKVGDRYSYDTKLDKEGDLVSMISRLMIGDMRNFLLPWSANGLEEFLRRAAYRNNSFALSRPLNAVKDRIESLRRSGYPTDVDRMIAFYKSPANKPRSETTLADRVNQYFDGMLLVYYFGYLDDDGKGAKLHEYYRTVAQDALAYRRYEESGRTTPSPAPGGRGQRAVELSKMLMRARSDAELREEMLSKFKSVGIKL